MTDYSSLSNEDLLALKDGNYSAVSDEGLLALKGSANKAPSPSEGLSTQDIAEESSPQSMLSKMQPSKIMPAVALGVTKLAETTGLDVTNIANPVANAEKALNALRSPLQTGKKLLQDTSRVAQAAGAPDAFRPTETEKAPVTLGKWAGLALETGVIPASGISRGGKIERAAETLDGLAGVPRGSSFALLKEPSRWADIFKSKAGVKAAYQKAVQAGESVAEDVSQHSFEELVDTATKGAVKSIKDMAKEVAPMMKIDPANAKAFAGTSALNPAKLTTFRKALNDQIGRLKTVLERGIENEKVNNIAVRQLVNYQEAARRVNLVLDKVAPYFRAADKAMAAQKQMAPFKQGLKAFAFGTGEAAAGAAAMTVRKAVPAADLLASSLENYRKARKRGGK